MCVCQIANVLRITQASVSRHLKKLRDAGLVDLEQDSYWTNYFMKAQNRYAEEQLHLLRRILNDDETVAADAVAALEAKRDMLCG